MATVTITLPEDDFVTVWGYVKDPFLNPIPASKIVVKVDPIPQSVNNAFIDRTEYTTLTNDEGYFELLLPGKLFITLVILDANFRISGQLPNTGIVEARFLGINP